MQPIADIRKDYKLQSLLESDVASDPFEQFARWWQQAIDSKIDEVNAMTLCTTDGMGMPQGRIVLLKDFSASGFVFYSNYNSHKGVEMATNPNATLVFFWKELERQVRISGRVEKVPAAVSDAYFDSRPPESRLGAWASEQSTTIPNREVLQTALERLLTLHPVGIVQRPPHWGGYVVKPTQIEFWQGRPSRLHDRILYLSGTNAHWQISRLSP